MKKIFQTLSKALDVSSATAQVAPDMLKASAILSDTQLSEDLQLIRKTLNHTGNQIKDHISLGDQESYYLLLFTRFSKTLLTTERRLTGQ